MTKKCKVIYERPPRPFKANDVWRIYCNNLDELAQGVFRKQFIEGEGDCGGFDEDEEDEDREALDDVKKVIDEVMDLLDKDIGFLSELLAFMAGYALSGSDYERDVSRSDDAVRDIVNRRARGRNKLSVSIVDSIVDDVVLEFDELYSRGRNLSSSTWIPTSEIGEAVFGKVTDVQQAWDIMVFEFPDLFARMDFNAENITKSVDEFSRMLQEYRI